MKKLVVLLFIAVSGLSADTWTVRCQDRVFGNDLGIRWIQSGDLAFQNSCHYLCTSSVLGTMENIAANSYYKKGYFSTSDAYKASPLQEFGCEGNK